MSNCVLVLLPVETHGEFQVGPPQAEESRPAPPRFQTLSSPNLLYLDTTAGTNSLLNPHYWALFEKCSLQTKVVP